MDAVTEHRVDLTPATYYDDKGKSHGHGKAHMTYRGQSLGAPSDQPLFDGARRLLNLGLAKAGDMIVTYRGSTPSMRGTVGKAAELTVVETAGRQETETTKYVPPVFGFAKWRPMDVGRVKGLFGGRARTVGEAAVGPVSVRATGQIGPLAGGIRSPAGVVDRINTR